MIDKEQTLAAATAVTEESSDNTQSRLSFLTKKAQDLAERVKLTAAPLFERITALKERLRFGNSDAVLAETPIATMLNAPSDNAVADAAAPTPEFTAASDDTELARALSDRDELLAEQGAAAAVETAEMSGVPDADAAAAAADADADAVDVTGPPEREKSYSVLSTPSVPVEEEDWFRNDEKRDVLRALCRNLQSLSWERVDVCFSETRLSLAHADIVVRREGRNAVVRFAALLFLTVGNLIGVCCIGQGRCSSFGCTFPRLTGRHQRC